MLSDNETIKLLALAKTGDESAKNLLIINNSPLVKSIVKRYKNKGVEYDDLYQLGCVGMTKAINNFDESFGVKFSTYAVPMIAGEIKRYLRDDGSVKVSRSIKAQYHQAQIFIDDYRTKNNFAPSAKEIANFLQIDEQELMFVMESSKMPVSIYDSLDGDGSAMVLDKIPSDATDDKLIDKMAICDALNSLDDKDRKLIILRYFRDKTQSEVARELNVSQVQVSRLETKVLSKLKNKLKF